MNKRAEAFCHAFERAPKTQRFFFGCNPYAEMLMQHFDVAAVADDFSDGTEFAGVPVIRTDEIPEGAFVVSCLLGRPQTAEAVLAERPFEHLDFFAFHRYSTNNLPAVRFWGDFPTEYENHRDYYVALEDRLADPDSRQIWRSILDFRLSADIGFLAGFSERQTEQYFESFLNFREQGEVFADVGSFDGFTSSEFARRCPGYEAVHVFEPSANNMVAVRERLVGLRNVSYHELGLADERAEVRFSSSGSTSLITDDGDEVVTTDRLDDLVAGQISYLKIDIEGEELGALRGAKQTIKQHHPTIAVCVYHRTDDFRVLPEFILSVRNDYDLYLRHYTEGVVETVMYFVPSDRS